MSNRKSFVGGAALLAAAGLIGKVIGMFYRIFLTTLIGADAGMVVYTPPYSVYSFLLVLSSAGLPTAISRMVSARIATGNRAGAREVLISARRVLIITGLAASALMFVLAKPLAAMTGVPEAAPAFMALAPAIFFVCMISAQRGYFQGMQNMVPTAISQIIEQLGKVLIGFTLAYVLNAKYGYVWGAVGAIVGVTASEMLAMLFMMGRGAVQARQDRSLTPSSQREKGILRSLFAIAIPITIGSSMMPITNMVDSFLIIDRLGAAGFGDMAKAMYGAMTSIAKPLVDMPAVITLSMSMALVPAISSAMAARDKADMRRTARTGIKLAALIGLPAAVGMSMLAEPIVNLLYSSQSEATRTIGAQLLSLMAIGIFFLAMIQTMTGIFQGLGKPIVPVYAMAIGIVVKIVLNYVLIAVPQINIKGAAIATLACYGIAVGINFVMLLRLTRIGRGFVLSLLRPLFSAAGMGAVLWALTRFLRPHVGNFTFVALAVIVGVGVYLLLALCSRALAVEELAMIPGGRRLTSLVYRGKHRK